MASNQKNSSIPQTSSSALKSSKRKPCIAKSKVAPVKLDFTDMSSSLKFKVKIIQKINFSATKSIHKPTLHPSSAPPCFRREEKWISHFFSAFGVKAGHQNPQDTDFPN